MKKFISWLLLPVFYLLSLLSIPVRSTKADELSPAVGSYACVLTDAYFYSQPTDQNGLFLLPKTYFVKTLEYSDTFCKIEYLYDDDHVSRLVGYAKTEELTFVDFIPERPYLYYLFEISYTLDKSETETPTQNGLLQEITFTCAYYGDYPIGSKTYCYVLRGEEFGYIPKPETLVFEPNTEYQAHQNPIEKEEFEPQEESAPSGVQIAILVAFCLLVPILAAFILKPPRRPPYDPDEP